jgi:aminoglycoside phosphotransferase (APT) family kinase protein
MPADPDRHGATVEAPADWDVDVAVALAADANDLDVIVWGRLPDPRASLARGLRSALAREQALRRIAARPPAGCRVAGVHRLTAGGLGGGLRGRVRTWLRAGALVELTTLPPGARVLDAVLGAAGAALGGADARLTTAPLGFGSGGTLIARVTRGETEALLRLAAIGAPGDPARTGDTLEVLAGLGVALAPRPLGRGTAAGASWTLETRLPGRRPARLEPQLARQVAAALAAFPRTDGPPLALEADLRGIVARVPSRAERSGRLAESIAAEIAGADAAADAADDAAGVPAVLRHGDLWTGNLLVSDRALSGIIDWDAAHPAGVPGSDLLQLVATELRARQRRSLGEAYVARPWDSTQFREAAADYWPAIGIEPSPRLIELAGLAWWAAEVNGTVSRLPHRATDERWLRSNVDPVLAALGY